MGKRHDWQRTLLQAQVEDLRDVLCVVQAFLEDLSEEVSAAEVFLDDEYRDRLNRILGRVEAITASED